MINTRENAEQHFMFKRAMSIPSLCVVLACLALQPAIVHSKTPTETASTSVEEFTHAYLQWLKKHPDAIQSPQIKLEMPALDLYSPSGVSVYYGTDSAKNAAFLRMLPKSIPRTGTTAIRPSLREMLEMFSEFKTQEDALLADGRYTVFAVTYPDWGPCKEQNEEIARLRARAAQAGIRVLEVRLHQ